MDKNFNIFSGSTTDTKQELKSWRGERTVQRVIGGWDQCFSILLFVVLIKERDVRRLFKRN